MWAQRMGSTSEHNNYYITRVNHRCYTRGANSKQLPVLLCNLKNDRAKYYKSPLLSATETVKPDYYNNLLWCQQITVTVSLAITISHNITTAERLGKWCWFQPEYKVPTHSFISCVLCSTMRFGSGALRPGGRLKLFVTLLGPLLSRFLWCSTEAFSSRGDQCIHLALKYKAFLYPQRKIPA